MVSKDESQSRGWPAGPSLKAQLLAPRARFENLVLVRVLRRRRRRAPSESAGIQLLCEVR